MGSYLMRNFKKTLSFLLSTVIIQFHHLMSVQPAFAATDVHTYKKCFSNTEILDDNTAEICGYYGQECSRYCSRQH